MSNNLKSVIGIEEVVWKKISKEIVEGRVLGPFKEPPITTLRVSPLVLVLKKAPGEYRLIHHFSYPAGDTVNDMVPQELYSVRYTSFDAAVCMIRACGHGTELSKCDIQLAFCLLPVHPSDFELLWFAFEGCYYMDKAFQWDASYLVLHLSVSARYLSGCSSAECSSPM